MNSPTHKRRMLTSAAAHRVTNETYRYVTDARFHPSGHKVIATKWYTSDRSLGAGESWEYSVPHLKDIQKHPNKIHAGSGTRVVGRSLPLGWTAEDYGDQQIGPEQAIWKGSDAIIYTKNIQDANAFTYSKGWFILISSCFAIFHCFFRCPQRNLFHLSIQSHHSRHHNPRRCLPRWSK